MRTLRSLLVAMQRLLERTRRRVALSALTAALGLLGAVAPGCESEPTGGLYGPPPTDVVEASGDALPSVDVRDVYNPDLYGCADACMCGACDDVADEVRPPDDVVENWATDVYGCLDDFDEPEEIAPPPPDELHEAVPDVAPEGTPVLYGPPPDDVGPPPDADVAPEAVPDVQKDCPPMGLYGPPPCTSDAECQADRGANWYCDQANSFPDGCGGTITYPQCKPKE